MNNSIPVFDWWFDGRNDLDYPQWDTDYVEGFRNRFTMDKILAGTQEEEPYVGGSRLHILALNEFPCTGLKVAVIGSASPWIEAICLNMGCDSVTTVEYNVPVSTYPNLSCVHYADFCTSKETFDIVLSYSSIEHSGLGRYGDILDPEGDLKAMKAIWEHLADDGLLFIGVPIGKDALTWNAHRVYGNSRLPLLLNGFSQLQWFGTNPDFINLAPSRRNGPQPVIVCRREPKYLID